MLFSCKKGKRAKERTEAMSSAHRLIVFISWIYNGGGWERMGYRVGTKENNPRWKEEGLRFNIDDEGEQWRDLPKPSCSVTNSRGWVELLTPKASHQ